MPEVARSLGKGVIEFKKGLKDVEHQIDKPAKSTNEGGSESGQDLEG